jgi:hypothetical protein
VGGRLQASAALPAGKNPSTHCAGGCVGPSAGLNGCGEQTVFCPHWSSNLEPFTRSESRYGLRSLALEEAGENCTMSFKVSRAGSVAFQKFKDRFNESKESNSNVTFVGIRQYDPVV